MSTGGMLALLLAPDVDANESHRPSAVVAYMPIVDMRDVVGNVRATPSLGSSPELAPTLSPVDFVTPDDPPVLFTHGRQDQVVPMEPNSVRLRALLAEAGAPSDLVTVDAGHELFAGDRKATADRAVVE